MPALPKTPNARLPAADAGCHDDLVVELQLSQYFQLARASHSYRQLLSQLPPVFVGHTRQLLKLVHVFSRLMAQEYTAHVSVVVRCPPAWPTLMSVCMSWVGLRLCTCLLARLPGCLSMWPTALEM